MGQTTAVRASSTPTVVVTMEANALDAFPSEREAATRPGTTLALAAVPLAHAVRPRAAVTMRVAPITWGVGLGLAAVLLGGAISVAAISVVARGPADDPFPSVLISRQ